MNKFKVTHRLHYNSPFDDTCTIKTVHYWTLEDFNLKVKEKGCYLSESNEIERDCGSGDGGFIESWTIDIISK